MGVFAVVKEADANLAVVVEEVPIFGRILVGNGVTKADPKHQEQTVRLESRSKMENGR